MASLAQQFTGQRCPLLSPSLLLNKPTRTHKLRTLTLPIVSAVAISNAQTKVMSELQKMFDVAHERCRLAPMEGVAFTIDDFQSAVEKFGVDSELGNKVKGTVFSTDNNGELVDITAKSSANLPLQEASLYKVKNVEEAGIVPGVREEFMIIGGNDADDSLILSTYSIELTWEQCRQLQTEDVVVKGKIVDANKGGIVAGVQSLRGFLPFSHT